MDEIRREIKERKWKIVFVVMAMFDFHCIEAIADSLSGQSIPILGE